MSITEAFKTYDPVACGWWEKGRRVLNEEEVDFVLVEGRGEVIRLGLHDVPGKSNGLCEPTQ